MHLSVKGPLLVIEGEGETRTGSRRPGWSCLGILVSLPGCSRLLRHRNGNGDVNAINVSDRDADARVPMRAVCFDLSMAAQSQVQRKGIGP